MYKLKAVYVITYQVREYPLKIFTTEVLASDRIDAYNTLLDYLGILHYNLADINNIGVKEYISWIKP